MFQKKKKGQQRFGSHTVRLNYMRLICQKKKGLLPFKVALVSQRGKNNHLVVKCAQHGNTALNPVGLRFIRGQFDRENKVCRVSSS